MMQMLLLCFNCSYLELQVALPISLLSKHRRHRHLGHHHMLDPGHHRHHGRNPTNPIVVAHVTIAAVVVARVAANNQQPTTKVCSIILQWWYPQALCPEDLQQECRTRVAAQ